jgi:hypothetical protein
MLAEVSGARGVQHEINLDCCAQVTSVALEASGYCLICCCSQSSATKKMSHLSNNSSKLLPIPILFVASVGTSR